MTRNKLLEKIKLTGKISKVSPSDFAREHEKLKLGLPCNFVLNSNSQIKILTPSAETSEKKPLPQLRVSMGGRLGGIQEH